MPMRVLVTNEDQARNLRVFVREAVDGQMQPVKADRPLIIAPAGSAEVWLRDAQDFVCEVVPG